MESIEAANMYEIASMNDVFLIPSNGMFKDTSLLIKLLEGKGMI